MPRLKCIVEYDGTQFVGWQRQLNGRSIQEAIEQAIEKIAEKKITIIDTPLPHKPSVAFQRNDC